jgi:hypothetical protein
LPARRLFGGVLEIWCLLFVILYLFAFWCLRFEFCL